jgi:tetratricopeptide (TPR) repeat protein
LTKSGVASGTAKADPILMTNQMMLVFMERMKSGNLNEAREVANEMIFGHEKYLDSDLKEHKSFHSAMEKELYGIIAKRAGSSKKVEWVEQPVSDGFYFLAILDFQEGRHEDALANLGKAIFWNPVRSAFYNERGFMLLKKNSGPDLTMAQVAYMKALELADNNEDLAAALRGLAFVLVERNLLDQALACLLVSKTYDASNDDADEEIMFIRRQAPALVTGMDLAKAGELLRANAIPAGFAADHVQVLINLADDYTAAKDNQKAAALLKKAMEMAPENQEVARRLKAAGK